MKAMNDSERPDTNLRCRVCARVGLPKQCAWRSESERRDYPMRSDNCFTPTPMPTQMPTMIVLHRWTRSQLTPHFGLGECMLLFYRIA